MVPLDTDQIVVQFSSQVKLPLIKAVTVALVLHLDINENKKTQMQINSKAVVYNVKKCDNTDTDLKRYKYNIQN